MAVTQEEFSGDALRNYTFFLRDNVTDPISSSRDSTDPFIFFGEVDAEIGLDHHKVPFVLVTTNDDESDFLGSPKLSKGTDHFITFTVRVIAGSEKDIREIYDAVKQATQITRIDNPSGTDPYTGNSYDIEKLSEPEEERLITRGQRRGEFRDDDYKEKAFDVNFQAWLVPS